MMKQTATLKIGTDSGIGADRFVINPNDGFDLGLLTQEHELFLCSDADEFQRGEEPCGRPAFLQLSNDCPRGCLRMSVKAWKEMGMPDSCVVMQEGRRFYLHPGAGK